VNASFAVNGILLGWGPAGFHLVNVLLHAAGAALVLLLARRLGCHEWAAWCAAALFALHPAAAWPVGSVVARVDLLPVFFVLCSWLALAQGTVWTGFFFLLALLSKESAAAFLVVPVLDLRTMRYGGQSRSPLGRVWLGLAGGIVTYILLRRAIGLGFLIDPHLIDPLTNPMAGLPGRDRFWSAVALTGRYLLYLFVPVRFSDPTDYLAPGPHGSPLDPRVAFTLLALLAWVVVILVLWVRRDRVAGPLAFSLASFLPASNLLFPISSLYAQNFLYMPLLGLSLSAGMLLGRIGIPPGRRIPWPALAATPILAVLGVGSFLEAGIWRDGLSLFSAWTTRFPHYSLAHSNLGLALMNRGAPSDAIPSLRKALEITEQNAEAHYNLGVALLLTKDDTASRTDALLHLRRSAQMLPDLYQAHVNASKTLLLLERPADAESEAREALRLAPGFEPALVNLSEALFRQSRYAEAADAYREIAARHLGSADARSNYVVSLINAGRWEEARTATRAARRDFPQAAWFDFCLARVEARTGHPAEAQALLETSLAKDPTARDWLGKADDFRILRGTRAFEALLRPDPAHSSR
jgi:protein O-mannosyl-transferase